ncbi:hypothetical protein FOZ62_012063, partial [Perkinsus olseni]
FSQDLLTPSAISNDVVSQVVEIPLEPSACDGEASISVNLTQQESDTVEKCLSNIVESGWSPVRYAPDYQRRLRLLKKGELADIPQQSYAFELRLPSINPSKVPTGTRYAVSLYSRLPSDERQIYDNAVSDYVKLRWWKPTDSSSRSLPPAQVFLITDPNGVRRPRLVVDFRELNRALPRASNKVPTLWQFLAVVRLSGYPVLFSLDAKQAFYRVRVLSDDGPLKLETGCGIFTSDRMCFGISCGPCGLDSTYGDIILVTRENVILSQEVILAVFLDDVAAAGYLESTLSTVRVTISLGQNCGFDVQQKKFKVIVQHELRKELHEKLLESGITLSPSSQLTLLGVAFSFEGKFLVASCGRDKRM